MLHVQKRRPVQRRDRKPKHKVVVPITATMRCPTCLGKVRLVDEETVVCRSPGKFCYPTDYYEAMKAFDKAREEEMTLRTRVKPRLHASKGQLISEGLELKANLEECNEALKLEQAKNKGLETQVAQLKNVGGEQTRKLNVEREANASLMATAERLEHLNWMLKLWLGAAVLSLLTVLGLLAWKL